MEKRLQTGVCACCVPPYPMLDARRRLAKPLFSPSGPRLVRPNRWKSLVASEVSTIASGGGGLVDRYAAALYSYADETHVLDSVVSEMEALGRLIDASADFRRLLESPLIDIKAATQASQAV